MIRIRALSLLASCTALLGAMSEARAQSGIFGWGQRVFDSRWNNESFVQVAAGSNHTLALRGDGSIAAWGDNLNSECNVPAPPAGLSYLEVRGGDKHSLARLSDGSVVAWGDNSSGECNVPALPPGVSYVQISAGWDYSLALRSDGSLLAWGYNQDGQCNVPILPIGLAWV
ncbi:MAG: hypothetical protein ABI744_08430, partial [Chloroflexota bacterium]